jgi:iron complex outermembrane receptor protein
MLSAASLLALAAAGGAAAQVSNPGPPAPAGGPPDTGAVAEVIVTAQRREQSLQQVPVAVTSLGGEYLASRQIQSIDKLSSLAPGLNVVKGATDAAATVISIRGSATTNQGILFEPAVGVYVDNVYVGKSYGSIFDIPDLERVEVLRGPQGTLYGRNTLAGALSLVMRKPSGAFRAEVEGSYGNLDYRQFKALVNIPITDSLFVKLDGQVRKRDGFTRYTTDPNGFFPTWRAKSGGDDLDRTVGDLQVRWAPNEMLTVDYGLSYSRVDEHPLTTLVGFDAGGILDPASPAYIGAPAFLYVKSPDKRPDTIAVNDEQRQKVTVWGNNLTATLYVNGVTLKSITGYRTLKVIDAAPFKDVDGSPLAIAGGGFNTKYHAFSQEFQASGKLLGDRLNYVVGGFYFDDSGNSLNPQTYFFGSSRFDTRLGGQTRSLAAYAQADYALTPTVTLSGGLRYTRERKQVERFYQIQALPGFPLPLPFTAIDITRADDVHKTFSDLSPTAIIAWQAMPTVNLYAKYARGYRSGGFNGEATDTLSVATPYGAETNTAYEAGLKSQFFERRLQLNLAGYYNRQSNKQLSVFTASSTAATVIQNAGKSHVYGLEVEVLARPVRSVTLTGSFGVLSQAYDGYLDTAANGQVREVGDNRVFAQAPERTASGAADVIIYRGVGTVHVAGSVSYRSGLYTLPNQKVFDPAFPLVGVASDVRVPAVTTLGLQIRWNDIPLGSTTANVSLWGENLTDEDKPAAFIKFPPAFGGLRVANYMDGRTFGLTVGMKY